MKRLAVFLFLCAIATASHAGPSLQVQHYFSSSSLWLYWSSVPGAASYRVERTSSYPSWSVQATGISGTSWQQTGLAANTTYIYRVVPVDGSGNPVGTASNAAVVNTHPYADNPLNTDHSMALQHILQLRTAVASVRAAAGAGTAVWTNTLSTGSLLADEDVNDLRSSLNAAFSNLGLTPPSYVDADLSNALISRVHIQQLRDLTRSYPEKVSLAVGAGISEAYFSPNGDGTKDTTTFTSSIAFAGQRVDFRWRVDVRNNVTNDLVRSQSGAGPAVAFAWDGRNGAGAVQPETWYRFELVDLDSLPLVLTSGLTRLDLTPPTATITAPADAYMVSNVRLAGSGNVTVTGSALDETLLQEWTLERTGNAQSTATIGSGTTGLSSGTFATWQTLPSSGALANGEYSLKLTVLDKAGNSATDTVPVTVGHFTVSRSAAQANAGAGGSVTYTSVIPYPLHLKLEILRGSILVRTLVDGSVGAATRNDLWDLRDGPLPAGLLVQDGAYRYVATVTDGAYSLVWDKLGSFPTSPAPTQFQYPKCWTGSAWVGCDQTSSLNFDPYGGVPLRMAYCVGGGDPDTGCTGSTPAVVVGKVTSQTETETSDVCSNNCFIEEYQAGRQELLWYGLGTGGWNYLADQPRLTVIRKYTSIPDSMTIVYGTAPAISNVTISPRMFSPPSVPLPESAQTFTLSVTSFNHRQVKATASFTSMDGGALLRTITTPLQPDGDLTFTWDGRADDPLHTLVAPGNYAVTIVVADENGSQKIVRPIVVVRY